MNACLFFNLFSWQKVITSFYLKFLPPKGTDLLIEGLGLGIRKLEGIPLLLQSLEQQQKKQTIFFFSVLIETFS